MVLSVRRFVPASPPSGRLRAWTAAWAVSILLSTVGAAWAAGGKPAEKLVNVVDTRTLTGLSKWVAGIYNENLWLYGFLVVGVMVAMGVLLGFAVDRAMPLIGIELEKLDHHE